MLSFPGENSEVSFFTQLRKQLLSWFARSRQGRVTEVYNITEDAKDIYSTKQHRVGLVAYDENLLERTRTQWQFGDWASLVKLEREVLQHHPDRAKLALLAAAGHMQQGNAKDARQFTRLAQDWGCSKKLVSQILIAGVHNSLGRAAAVNGEGARAHLHFESAIAAGVPTGDIRLLTQARLSEQCTQLGFASDEMSLKICEGNSSIYMATPWNPLAFTVLAERGFAGGWRDVSENTKFFCHHGVLTSDNYQYIAFYVDNYTLRIVQIDLTTNIVRTKDISGGYNLCSPNNNINLGVDRSGYLHIIYELNTNQYACRRAIVVNDIELWSDEYSVSIGEGRVTYLAFILPRLNFPFMLLYCDFADDKYSIKFKTYDEVTGSWLDFYDAMLSGCEPDGLIYSVYCDYQSVEGASLLYLAFAWQINSQEDGDDVNKISFGYASFLGNEFQWVDVSHRFHQLPIISENVEITSSILQSNRSSIKMCMALDNNARPHIVYYFGDKYGVFEYHYLWFDGKIWRSQLILNGEKGGYSQGSGVLPIPVSGPEIVIDKDNNTYVIYRGKLSRNCMVAMRLSATDYSYNPDNMFILYEDGFDQAEFFIDNDRWQRDNVLTICLQHDLYSNSGIGNEVINESIALFDIRFN